MSALILYTRKLEHSKNETICKDIQIHRISSIKYMMVKIYSPIWTHFNGGWLKSGITVLVGVFIPCISRFSIKTVTLSRTQQREVSTVFIEPHGQAMCESRRQHR